MATNITGLDREDVARLLRLAEKDVEKLQRDLREVTAYSARLEQELEALSPECPSCLQIRRDRGGDPRAPAGQHQEGCPEGRVVNERHAEAFDILPEDKAAILTTGEMWEIRWYPDTPVGYCTVAAATLERALELACR